MAMGISVRSGLAGERSALEALQRRASLANERDREALLAHPDAIALPLEQIEAGHVFVAEREGQIAGFAVALPREDGQFELDGLFVEPHLWKGGVGRALVDRCAAYARGRGAKALHVIGNPHAEGFYISCGFEVRGAHQTQFGEGLLMKKALAA
jgi:GNAT superfamily N-acetyltransferase